MPAWILKLVLGLGSIAWTAVLATVKAFITEKRIREYFVYTARWFADKNQESQWWQRIAADLEKDWEKEYKEDI
jgi:hypothetical protein